MRVAMLTMAVMSLLIASAASGLDHFPFDAALVCEYEYSLRQGSGTYRAFFSGTANVNGVETRVLHWAGGVDDGLLSFWSENSEGDKFVHGGQIGDTQILYSPPILMIDEPLYVDKTWTVITRDSDGILARVQFRVTAFGEITVPAGTFQAFTVEDLWEYPEYVTLGSDRALLVRGQPVDGATQQAVQRTYADVVGLLLRISGSRTDRLRSLTTIAVQSSTWTRIRLLYR